MDTDMSGNATKIEDYIQENSGRGLWSPSDFKIILFGR